jgi:hypothetical protein
LRFDDVPPIPGEFRRHRNFPDQEGKRPMSEDTVYLDYNATTPE